MAAVSQCSRKASLLQVVGGAGSGHCSDVGLSAALKPSPSREKLLESVLPHYQRLTLLLVIGVAIVHGVRDASALGAVI